MHTGVRHARTEVSLVARDARNPQGDTGLWKQSTMLNLG